ncbi:hypothetical protein B0H19DRAFT_1066808 [Mycena capillaripes]|nr:hypothetical protein B0H19DRAFT_1066808 [Mycena capillaripes]
MATVHLPPELWIEVFQYLRPISRRALHSVSSLLRDISRPFLFDEVYLELNEDENLKHFSDRLAFLSSSPIAPCVRKVQLSTRDSFSETPFSLDCPNTSTVAALRAITCFVNLKSLRINFWSNGTHADLSRLGLEALENLDELAIIGCSFHSPNIPSAAKIRVKRLSLRFCHFTHHSRGLPGLRRSFLPIIDPKALCLLALAFDPAVHAYWLMDDVSPPRDFPNLRELQLTGSVSRTQLGQIFARFPAIRRFSIDSLLGTPTPLVVELQAFTGPCALLPLVLPHTGCSELTLDLGGLFGGAKLADWLAAAGRSPSVTSLTLTLSSARLGAWKAPYDAFALIPNVTELRLIIWFEHVDDFRDTVTRETYPEILARVLCAPPYLEHVIIEGSETLPFTVPERESEDYLRSAVPTLRGIRFRRLITEGRRL